MNIRPMHDCVLIRHIKDSVSSGGIVIPDNAADGQIVADVVDVGPGKRDSGEIVPVSVKIGDRVLLGKHPVLCDVPSDKSLAIIREYDIIAVVSE